MTMNRKNNLVIIFQIQVYPLDYKQKKPTKIAATRKFSKYFNQHTHICLTFHQIFDKPTEKKDIITKETNGWK